MFGLAVLVSSSELGRWLVREAWEMLPAKSVILRILASLLYNRRNPDESVSDFLAQDRSMRLEMEFV